MADISVQFIVFESVEMNSNTFSVVKANFSTMKLPLGEGGSGKIGTAILRTRPMMSLKIWELPVSATEN